MLPSSNLTAQKLIRNHEKNLEAIQRQFLGKTGTTISSNTNQETKQGFFKTEVGISEHEPEASDEESDDEMRVGEQIFRVEEAFPPPDFYEGAYTPLPPNAQIASVKRHVENNVSFSKKKEKQQWVQMFESEHATALICDSFWYIICRFFKTSEENTELMREAAQVFLDRLSANYVSFLMNVPKKEDKDFFFSNKKKGRSFHDALAQAVFYALYYAYPKSRSKFNDAVKKTLIEEFAYQFTGMKVEKPNWESWRIEIGAGNVAGQGDSSDLIRKDIFDLDGGKRAGIKAKRDKLDMRYSPLVERYLKRQKYETINNVRMWKMLLTRRGEQQDQVDQKMKNYVRMANEAQKEAEYRYEKYIDFEDKMKAQVATNEKHCRKHLKFLESKKQKILENKLQEYANYLVSIYNNPTMAAELEEPKI